jgi:diguanylate cyclase (GGDEF)-like protein
VTGAALAIVAAILATLLVLERTVYQPNLDAAIEATRALRVGHEAMLDQETGLRGYLLSHDHSLLQPYERGRALLSTTNAEMTRRVGGRGRAGALLIDMRVAQQAWQSEWATEALRRGREDVAADAAFLDAGRTRFDAYRSSFEALADELVRERRAALDDQQRAVVVALVLALAVIVASGWWGRAQARRLRAAVGEPLDALTRRLGDIGRGDLAPDEIPAGPAEFRAIALGVEATAAALADARSVARERSAQLEARSRRQVEVLALAREVSGSLSLRYVLRGVSVHTSAVADGARVVVWLLDSTDRETLEAVADTEGPDLRPLDVAPVALGDDLVGRAAQHGRLQTSETDLAIPMVVGAEVIGVIECCGPEVARLDRDALDLLETVAVHAAAAIGAARVHEHTAELAVTDALTGLPNRRRLERDLRVEVNASMRYGRPLALLMIDVDHFKSYNDTFGHQAGDAALQSVARVLATGLRASDIAYRYGGEEFVLILRETTRSDAVVLAERIRSAVEHHFSAPSHLRAVTISVGVAGLPEHGPAGDTLTHAADEALYEAKSSGRNRVVVARSASVDV